MSKSEEKVFEILLQVFDQRDIMREHTFDWLRDKSNLRLDFYIPKINVAIEVQGDQHFRPVGKFGGERKFYKRIGQDYLKLTLCENNGINIIYFSFGTKRLARKMFYPVICDLAELKATLLEHVKVMEKC